MNSITKYNKAMVAVLATVLSAILAATGGDGIITAIEWINVAVAGTTAASVLTGPNVPGARYTKAILAGLGAALVLMTSAITGGITTVEWIQIGVQALGAVAVLGIENK